MAIYPYRCERCSREWDEIQSPLSAHTSVCPGCGQPGRRIWSQIRIAQNTHFRSGYDWSLGRYFDSQRQRDEYLKRERPSYRPVDPIPKGRVVEKVK